MNHNFRYSRQLPVILLLSVTTFAQAAEVVDEIVVTATKREQNLQDVPQAVSAVTGSVIQDLGISDIGDVALRVPGIQYASSRPGDSQITMRGLSPLDTINSPVAIYLDEMLINSTGTTQQDVRTFDLDRVEIIRGPGGTLYGESSLGGTIKYITRKPNVEEFEGRLESYASSTNEGGTNYGLSGVVNLPVAKDVFAIRLVGYYDDLSGWIDQLHTGKSDVNSNKIKSGRIIARYVPADGTTVDFTALFHDVESDGPSLANFKRQNFSLVDEPSEDDTRQYNLTLHHDFSASTLTASVSRRERDVAPSITDRADVAFALGPVLGTTAAWQDEPLFENSWVAEVRLASSQEGRFRWTTGLFYEDSELSVQQTGYVVPEIPDIFHLDLTQSFKQLAGFGEMYYDLSNKLELTLGGRWFTEDRKSSVSQFGLLVGTPASDPDYFADSADEQVFTPKINLSYRPTQRTLMYGQICEGFRAGGVNPFAKTVMQNLANDSIPGNEIDIPSGFDPETVWNYEIGLKSTLADGRITSDIAVFYMDWQDLQVSLSHPDDPVGFDWTQNVGKAHTQGVEFELNAVPTDRLDLSLSVTYIEAKIDDATPPPGTVGPDIKAGTDLALVPDWRVSAALRYRWPLRDGWDGMIAGDASWTDKSVSNVIGDPRINDSYSLLNLRVGLEGNRVGIYLYGRNLTDEFVTYSTGQKFDITSVPFGTEYLKLTNQPRTYGLRLSYTF